MEDPTIFLNRLGKFVIFPVGMLLLVAAAWSAWSTKTWLARTVETEGVVIEMVRVRDSENKGYLFYPIVRFETADGRTHEFESSLRTDPPAYRRGEVVSVVYEPALPDAAAIRGVLSLWFTPIILGFIGTIIFGIGAAMITMSNWVSRVLNEPRPAQSASPPSPKGGAAFGRTRS